MTYKVMVNGGYNLTDMGDYRDRFKRILNLLELNSIYVTRHSKTRRFSHSVDLHKTDLKLPNTE